ncbi:MAG: HYR domain-containing protein [Bacteroidetes bacterium]|nr:HYR domain-containing protein [Bacteroidota bacterium]
MIPINPQVITRSLFSAKNPTLVLILLLITTFAFLPKKALALNPGDVSITMTTAPFFIADSNSPPQMQGPQRAYVGFEVCNTSGGTLMDVVAEMTSVTGTVPGFALSGGQNPIQTAGTMAAGECRTFYWFVEYPYLDKDETGTFEITVSDSNPGTVSDSDDVVTRNSISANAGGIVINSVLGPGIFVGQAFYMDVVYEFGNVQNGDEFTFQPAGNVNFNADCFQLINSEVLASDLAGVGIPVGVQNQMYFTSTGSMGGSGNSVTVRYYFEANCVGNATTASPYAGQTSGGTNFKYTGNFDDPDFPDIVFPPAENGLTITKEVNQNMASPPDQVIYTVTLSNSTDQVISVDHIDDVLPTPFTFNSIDPASDVNAANSSSVPTLGDGGTISWKGCLPATFPYTTYEIPANGSIQLIYLVDVPAGAAAGNYQNSVTATSGDFTTPPATTSVGIGSCVVNIDCPSDIIVPNDPGLCSALVDFPSPEGTGSCGPFTVEQTAGPASGSAFPVGTTMIEFTVTDANGNTATCGFLITVQDTELPEITCPADITVGNDPGQCGALINYAAPIGTDNCPDPTTMQISGQISGSFFAVDTVVNVFLVTDASGNTATCSFTVIVEDGEMPDLQCPSDIPVSADEGLCSAVVEYDVTATDNCDDAVMINQTEGLASGAAFPIGTTTNCFEVIDSSGNVANCCFDVVVTDDEDPEITCPGDISVDNDSGLCSAVVEYSITTSDNCPGETITQTQGLPSGSAFPVGTTTNCFEVTDASGNQNSCCFDVVVTDAEAPVITCPGDIAVNNDPGICGALVEYTMTSSDNCPGETVVQTQGLASGEVFPVGTTTNCFTITDAAGLSASCCFDVTVTDAEAPTINCPADISVNNDPGICGAVVTYSVTTNDNCPGETLIQTEGLASGNVFPVGTTTNCFEVTDAAGITAACCFDVTVTDTEPPVISCPNNIIINLDPGECQAIVDFVVSATDNCDPNPDIVQIDGGGLSSGDFFYIGNYTLEFEATDLYGNSSTCDFTITVNEYANPTNTLTCNDLITFSLDQNGEVQLNADFLLEGGPYGCYDDYIIDVEGPTDDVLDCSHIGEEWIVSVTDPETGNYCWSTIIVEDKLAPVFDCPTTDVEISCTENIEDVPPPTATDNCLVFDIQLVYEETIDDDACDDNTVRIRRDYIAIDQYGNQSDICSQIVALTRPDDVDFPDDLEWECSDYETYPNIIEATPYTGVPATTGSGIPEGIEGEFCMYNYVHSDNPVGTCGNTFKIIRTWTVLDWCTSQVITSNDQGEDNIQIIKIIDTTPPVISMQPFEVSANIPGVHPQPCTSQDFLPPAMVTDNCNDITLRIFTPVGEAIYVNGVDGAQGGLIPSPGLALGFHQITYQAEDVCGNISQLDVTIEVVDDIAPTTICDEITEVALSSNGQAIVPAGVFDDGSFDNCGVEEFLARRMDGLCDGGFDDFGPTVEFCCSDVPNSPIMVVFRVVDYFGNVNDCMVQVYVDDKIPPITTFCPGPQTISCEEYLDELGAPLANEDYSVLEDFGTPAFYDNCALNTNYSVTVNIDNCQEGTIVRTWITSDDNPTNPSANCTQTIFVEHVSDWVVEFPADILVECTDGQLPDFGEPEIFFDECELIGVSFDDDYFYVVPDACYKIVRTWTVINWCIYDDFGYDAFAEEDHYEAIYFTDWDGDGDQDDRTFRDGWNDSGAPGTPDGYIVYEQVIKVNDNQAPQFVVPSIDGCIVDTDCDTDLTLPYPDILDQCSASFEVDISGDFGSFADIQDDVIIPDVAPGSYTINYAVTDDCGNTEFESIDIVVEDCKLPSPYCLNGIVVEIMQTGMIEVWASDLDLNSFDNCPGDLIFSFSPDVTDLAVTYTCDDLGQIPVEMWVTDAAGNQDFCETFIVVQDNMDVCDDPSPIVSGLIATEEVEPVEMVMIDVNGGMQTAMTGADGMYSLSLPEGGDYSVIPMLDTNHGNGVSTYDMVLISQHILGLVPLDSPYKMIAADANNSGSISTLDLVDIQTLILQLADEFPNNTSWRFVEADYVFPNPQDPWEENFPEIVNFNDLAENMQEVDFVAVKVGDVNSTAQTSEGFGETGDRTFDGSLNMRTPTRAIPAGETIDIYFSGDGQSIFGYQFTLQADPHKLWIEQILPGELDAENFGTARLSEGLFTTSWYSPEVQVLPTENPLFGLRITAREDIDLATAIKITSEFTSNEAYGAQGEWLQVALEFEQSGEQTEFALYQNRPNPFGESTSIGFFLPKSCQARLTITDISGKVIRVLENTFQAGYHEWEVQNLSNRGVYYYQLQSDNFTATKKMVRQ